MKQARGPLYVIAIAYTITILTMIATHEPWRDEIEMWLMARDASVLELIQLAPNMGTPLLWPLLLKPFAVSGFGLITLQVIQFCCAFSAALIFLFYSRFHGFWKFWILSGYYLNFEYAVIARNYSLGILLLFSLAALDPKRRQRPWCYGVILLLLCQTSVHFWFLAAVITLTLIYEFLVERSRALWPAVLLGGLGNILSVLLLYPRGEGQFEGLLVSNFRPVGAVVALKSAIFPMQNSEIFFVLAFCVWATFFLAVLRYLRVAFIATGGMASLLYIFCFKHIGGSWHFGLLFVLLVFCLWLYIDAPQPSPRTAGLERITRMAQRLFVVLFTITLPLATLPHARTFYVEFSEPHSLAGAMGELLKEEKLLSYTIAAHPATVTAAVLGDLPGVQFWYASTEEFGSYMSWDARHAEDRFIETAEVFRRIERAFPDRHEASSAVLVLLNERLEYPEQYGYVLFQATAEKPWRVKDERYFLYVPISFARARSTAPTAIPGAQEE